MAWEIVAKAKAFEEALAAIRKRVPMSDAAFASLLTASHETAFTIAHVAQVEVAAMVWQSLDRAMQHGVPFAQWKKDAAPMLEAAWNGSVKNPGARLETIYRNAVHTSYNHGRWEQMDDPDVVKLRPFREFDAIRDKRTSDICVKCDGTVLPADDPWWNDHVPPLHHRCRSKVRSLTKRQGQRKAAAGRRPTAAPDKGFGKIPKPGRSHLGKPDLSRLPEPLRKLYLKKVGQAAA